MGRDIFKKDIIKNTKLMPSEIYITFYKYENGVYMARYRRNHAGEQLFGFAVGPSRRKMFSNLRKRIATDLNPKIEEIEKRILKENIKGRWRWILGK